jgi:hypothetical protein
MRVFKRLFRRLIDSKIIQNVPLQIAGCADNQRLVMFAMKYIGTWGFRQPFDQQRVELERQHRSRQQALNCVADYVIGMLAVDHLPPLPENIGIRQCTVSHFRAQSMIFDQRIQIMAR